MKPEELMIGDWVNVFGIPKQMEGIREFRNGDEVVYYDGDNGNFIENVTPIPLTPEILEKNGFSKELDSDGIHYRFTLIQGCSQFSLLYARSVFQWLYPIDFKHVHELQHALRLCGIEKEIIL